VKVARLQRLRDDIRLEVVYRDQTLFGSMVSGRVERELGARVEPLVAPLVDNKWIAVDHHAVRRRLVHGDVLGEYFSAPEKLRPEFLYPDAGAVQPTALAVHSAAGTAHTIELDRNVIRELAVWIGAFHQGTGRPAASGAARLFDALVACDALTEAARPPAMQAQGATLCGHACVRVAAGDTRLLIDPFLPAFDAGAGDSAAKPYRPFSLHEIAADAVLISHSHPDHFDPGTLLRLGSECLIVVPRVARESVLAIDMATRLHELGFRRIRILDWHQALRIGEFTVRALPFFGEQPSDGEVLHSQVRNAGNTYLVEGAGRRYAFTVDAGRDHAGDIRDVAQAHAGRAPVDLVFAGYRGWSLFPAQLLRSSVRRYALFVPENEWARRHKLMCGVDEALDVAEAWQAKWLVPYANGGAPWFWNLGLGANLSVAEPEDTHFDPRPETLVRAARCRSSWGALPVPSPVEVRVIHPGTSVTIAADGLRQSEHDGHQWPFPSAELAELATSNHAEMIAIGRKKVLLRILARNAAEHLGITVGPGDIQRLGDHIRRVAGLRRRDDMLRWLQRCNLDVVQFSELMTEWARCNALEQRFAPEIDRLLPGQLALHSMRNAAALMHRP
jgi:L-ascorbate metabolism protein UlaG (beta-lactamase superfamily)